MTGHHLNSAEPVLDRAAAQTLITNAQRWFNTRDVTSIMQGYSADATLEMISEGLRDVAVGPAAIERAWRSVFAVFPKMQLEKQLVSVDPAGTVVNEWRGSVDGRSSAYGVDMWWLDPITALVTKHVVISFGRIVDGRSLAGGLRWLAIHPASSVRLARALRRR
jgi:hypothetical protein